MRKFTAVTSTSLAILAVATTSEVNAGNGTLPSSRLYSEPEIRVLNPKNASKQINSERDLLKRINFEIEEQTERLRKKSFAVKGTAYVLNRAIQFSNVPSKVPLLGIPAEVAGQLFRDSIDLYRNHLLDKFENEAANHTEKVMALYRAQTSEADLKDLLQEFKTNPEEALVKLDRVTKVSESEAYKGASQKQRIAMMGSQITTIATNLAITDIKTTQDINVLKSQVQATALKTHNASKLATEAIKISVNTQTRLEKLSKTGASLVGGIENLNQRVQKFQRENSTAHKTSHNFLDRMEAFQFRKMSPEDRLNALNDGWRPELQGEEREIAISDLEVEVKIRTTFRQTTETLTTVSSGLNNVAIIANGLGVDPDTIKVLNDVASHAETATKVISSVAAGNYLGAAAAVFGAFGKPKPDPAAKRHKQIMRALGKIMENQQAMMKGINNLIEGQNRMMENQQKIFQSINQLSKQTHLQYMQLTADLQEIKEIALNIQENLIAERKKGMDACLSYLPSETVNGKTRLISVYELDHQALASNFSSSGSNFHKCASEAEILFEKLKPGREEVDPILKLSSYMFEEKVVGGSGVKATDSITQFQNKVRDPIFDLHHLNAKDDSERQSVQKLRNNFFHLGKLLEFSEMMLALHPHFQLVGVKGQETGAITSGAQLLSEAFLRDHGAIPRTTGKDILEGVLVALDFAIAQQELLVGNGVLELIEGYLFADKLVDGPSKYSLKTADYKQKPDDLTAEILKRKRLASNALAMNDELKKNLVMRVLLKRMERNSDTDNNDGQAQNYDISEVELAKNPDAAANYRRSYESSNLAIMIDFLKKYWFENDARVLDSLQLSESNFQGEPKKSWRIKLVLDTNAFAPESEPEKYNKNEPFVELPDPDRIENLQFYNRLEKASLLKMRNLVVDALMEYDFWAKQDDAAKDVYTRLNTTNTN